MIVAGKLFADPDPVQPRFLSIVGSSVSALLHAQTRGDLYEVYALAAATGMNYHVTAVPPGVCPGQLDHVRPRGHATAVRGRPAAGRLARPVALDPAGHPAGRAGPVRGGVHLAPAPPG